LPVIPFLRDNTVLSACEAGLDKPFQTTTTEDTNIVGRLILDLRYAMRSLRRDRNSVTLALVALALGIGATTVIFSVVYGVLIDPFPYKNSEQLVHIYIHDLAQPGQYGPTYHTAKAFFDYKAQNHVFSDMMACTGLYLVYKLGNSTYRTVGAFFDPAMFSGLGVRPMLGREITESDGEPDAPAVFVISDRMWREKFNRDPRVLGMTLTLAGTSRTLIGIMPPRFLMLDADVWIPMKITAEMTAGAAGGPASEPLYVFTIARLRPGISLHQAAADIDVIAHNEARMHPELFPKQFKVVVGTIADRWTRKLHLMVYVLLGAVLTLLLIACGNVANLLLLRASVREKELAVRAAIGASRRNLIRILLAESFVLALAGTVIGCLLAYVGIEWVKATIPPGSIPAEAEIRLNSVTLLATVVVTLLTTLLCGLAPALQASRFDIRRQLSNTGKGADTSLPHGKLRVILVTIQMSLTIVLLAGGGLMIRTFLALTHVDLGFEARNILVAHVIFPDGQYNTAAAKQSFFRQVLPRIAALPGVTSLTLSDNVPVVRTNMSELNIPGSAHSQTWTCAFDLVGDDYFETIRLPLLGGRLLSAADIDSARYVALINQKFAHDFFGESTPIGRTIELKELNSLMAVPREKPFEIVGIVGDARNDGLVNDTRPEAFIPHTMTALADDTILVRTAVSPDSILENVIQVVSSIDQNVALADTAPLERILHREFLATPEFGLLLLNIFAGIGVILSAIGVFSMMSYTVSLQTHDIGIRMALGAQPESVLRMVLLRGLRLVLVSILIGLAASFSLTRLMASQLYGVSAADPWTFLGVAIFLGSVGVPACLLPARRATKVDPLVAVRYE
jgi:putative ABC transport system permease protein